MEIDYELEAKDFFEFGRAVAPKRKSYNSMLVLYFITYVLFIFADFIYAASFGSLSEWNANSLALNVLMRLAITFLLIGIVLGIVNLISRSLAKKAVDAGAENGVLCRHKIILSEKELIEVTDVNLSRHSWNGIGKIERLGDFIVIEVLGTSSYIIPLRFFRDSRYSEDFLNAANSFKQNAIGLSSDSYLADFDAASQTKL